MNADDGLLEYARLYRAVERRIREGQLGLDFEVERRVSKAETIPSEPACIAGQTLAR